MDNDVTLQNRNVSSLERGKMVTNNVCRSFLFASIPVQGIHLQFVNTFHLCPVTY